MNKKMLVLLIMMLFIPFVVDAYEVKKVWENNTNYGRWLIYEDDEILSFDSYIKKYDKNGNMLWEKSNVGGTFLSGTLTKDGGFILVGYSQTTFTVSKNDFLIVKCDKDGNMLWQKKWGGSDSEELYSISLTENGEFVVGGWSASTDLEGITNKGGYQAIIIKYDKDGNMLWQKNWSEPANGGDCFKTIFTTKSGDIFASDNYYNPAIIVKYDKDGNMLWQKNLGEDGMGEQLSLTNDEDIIAFSYPPYKMIKYDKDGNMLWEKDWPEDGYVSKFVLEKGDIIGVTDSYDRVSMQTDAMIVKFDIQGNIIWKKVFDIGEFSDVYSILFTKDGGFIVNGDDAKYNDKTVKFSIEYNLEMADMENGISTIEQKGKYGIVTPIPNEGYVVDKIIIKDTAGNEISVTANSDGTYTFELYDDVTIEVSFIRAFRVDVKDYANGNANIVKSEDNVVVITPTPDKGYGLDKIVVKNSKDEIVEVTKLEDGTYTFELCDDVTVEVLFKEALVNPKTGLFNYIGLLLSMLVCSLISFWFIMRKDKKFEL